MPPRPMPVNRSNDHDFVPPETYKPSKGPLPPELLALEALPDFKPLSLQDVSDTTRLPSLNMHPESIFRLLFND